MSMDTYDENFALLAELALALAGFGGVAAAFGGRERAYRPTELIRLMGVIAGSGSVLAGCFAIQTLLAAGVSASTTFVLASVLFFILTSTLMGMGLSRGYQAARAPDSTSERWALHLVSVLWIASLVLCGVNVTLGGRAWPLIGAFSIQLLIGLWIFTRMLTRPN